MGIRLIKLQYNLPEGGEHASKLPFSTIRAPNPLSFFDVKKRESTSHAAYTDKLSRARDFTATDQDIHSALSSLRKVKLSFFEKQAYKVLNFAIKLFNSQFSQVDTLLDADRKLNQLIHTYKKIEKPERFFEKDFISPDQAAAESLQTGALILRQARIKKLATLFSPSEGMPVDRLPSPIKKDVQRMLEEMDSSNEKDAVYSAIYRHLQDLIAQYEQVIQNPGTVTGKDPETTLGNLETPADSQREIYSVGVERLTEKIAADVLNKPIKIAMVGVEYAGFIKEGGLAEALEGMSTALKKQNPENQVRLVYPLFSHMPKGVYDKLEGPVAHLSGKGEKYDVYTANFNGVECHFIDHPSFKLSPEKPTIYGPDGEAASKRFAVFSELASDLLYEQQDNEVIHLHDWHVAGVALKLQKDHKEEWEEGKIPPVLFTFHNNNRCAQGRHAVGPYSYDPVIEGYRSSGIMDPNNENLFVKALEVVDGVTTVSENFALEAQQYKLGEGVSFAVRQAAKAGKLTGIINGTSTDRWNPEKDPTLSNWKDVDTGEPVDLSYGPDHPSIIEQKSKSRIQLDKWLKKHLPDADFDTSKPIVTYVGRFDAYQKGLDKLDESIASALLNGGQFICMGTAEDPKAKEILDRLEKKYPKGVLFIRDYKDSNGKFHYQQGNNERPGIGSVVRAVTDFTLVPSRFEPCGLVQFEGWLFGSMAIGSNTGGLADTIITPQKDPETFNGHLFEREGDRSKSVGKVIQKALKEHQAMSDEEKNRLSSRLIREGRQYGWNSHPHSFTPVERYRFAYENAKSRVAARKLPKGIENPVEAARHRLLVPDSSGEGKEERYLREYYSGKKNSSQLQALFLQLSPGERLQVPSPYGVNVDSSMQQRFGAFPQNGKTTFSLPGNHGEKVSVILYDRNGKKQAEHPMSRDPQSGDWTVIVDHIGKGQAYRYKVHQAEKLDPFGRRQLHQNGKDFSVVDASDFQWNDASWMKERDVRSMVEKPMSIFEIHPTTWKKKDGKPLNYRELAHEIVAHSQKNGFTHVELMGLLEHPDERSWGYQVTGYFAPNSRMGTSDDLKYLINTLHQNDIGVVLDWVPAHFAPNPEGLGNFGGKSLYEASGLKYAPSIRRLFFRYGAKHFNYSKKQNREFLISSANHWIKEYHVDALRVDCVRSILNSENQQSAKLFLRDLNAVVHKEGRGAITIAEEFSGDRYVTRSSHTKGLGFDMKWHSGWMMNTLKYFSKPLEERKKHYDLLTDAIECDNFHRQLMFIGHDQVTKEHKALIEKLDGSDEEKKANVRAMLSFMMALPGKKLNFMGNENYTSAPWTDFVGKQDSYPIADPSSQPLERLMKAMHDLYKNKKALSEQDSNGSDIEPIELNDPKKQLIAYRRTGSEGQSIAIFHNFTNEAVQQYSVTLKKRADGTVPHIHEILNTDRLEFGGNGKGNDSILTMELPNGDLKYFIQVPPLTTLMISEVD